MYGETWNSEYTLHDNLKDKIHHKILLIEDDPIIQTVNKRLLEMLNCQVDIAGTGQQAIAKSRNQYDLIFLDIGLPDMSGIDVCKQIRTGSACHDVPIVVLSAVADLMQDECVAAGADEIAVKPVMMDGLLKILNNWVVEYN